MQTERGGLNKESPSKFPGDIKAVERLLKSLFAPGCGACAGSTIHPGALKLSLQPGARHPACLARVKEYGS